MAAFTTEKPPGLTLDYLPSVDLTTLTQSELRALSFCSSSSFDPGRTDDISTPTVDRSNFNDSSASHRQTYSRPFSYHQHHRHRLAAVVSKAPNPPSPRPPTSNDSLIDSESHSIVSFLKRLLSSHPDFQQLELVDFDSLSHLNDAVNFTSPAIGVVNGSYRIEEKKRKRGRKPKLEVLLNVEEEKEKEIKIERVRETGLEIVNINGAVVDLVWLASLEDPYKDELRRRTQGMDKDDELLGFFRDLGGQWCSRRRKRKIVDASGFGDALPVGWKLLLGIRRKEGHAWVYCRRYISPGGQHFLSCKEVSEYLQSIFGNHDGHHMTSYASVNTQQIHKVVSESYTGATRNGGDPRQSGEHEKAASMLGTKNSELAEVQIHDTFQCYKCNMLFNEKYSYLEHLLSFHERTARRYRMGSSVSDGVIFKNGKYECQFCHKAFDEKRRYNSHVGIHVRNYIRGTEESPVDRMALQKTSNSPTNIELPARITRIDALIDIAQSSIQETSPSLNGETNGRVIVDQNVTPNPKVLASVSDHELKFDSSPNAPCIEPCLEQHRQKVDNMIIDKITQKTDKSDTIIETEINSTGIEQHGNGDVRLHENQCLVLSTVETSKYTIETKTDKHDDCESEDMDKTRFAKIEVEFQSNGNVADNKTIVEETPHQSLEVDDGLSNGDPLLSLVSVQPSPIFSATAVSLEEIDSSAMDKRNERITGLEDLKLDANEQLKLSFNNETEEQVNLVNSCEMDTMFDSSVEFESNLIGVDAGGAQGLTTQCIWCGIEFNHEGVDTELESDSVGYMCPTCKDKISGPLNVLGGGS